MLTLIHGGEVYTPDPIGVQSLLIAGDTILKIGTIDRQAVRALGVPFATIDASACVITPGWIDPHEHLIGAGGEEGFGTRLPEVMLDEIVNAGLTTVVGCLGTDMTTRHLSSVLAKVQQLQVQGISAYMYTGGYALPPNTLTGTVTNDLVMVKSVIGIGELAIADPRCSEPTPHELARLVSQGIAGGMIGDKPGITHFHVGPGKKRLSLLRTLIEEHETPVEYLYPTHINRSEALMDEAIDLARQGAFVDIDTVDDDLAQWLDYYRKHDGPLDQLTVSSDSHTSGADPAKMRRNLIGLIQEHGWSLSEVLPLCTRNPAAVLKLKRKGRLEAGMDADLAIMRTGSLDLVHVFARGHHMLKDGEVVAQNTSPTVSTSQP